MHNFYCPLNLHTPVYFRQPRDYLHKRAGVPSAVYRRNMNRSLSLKHIAERNRDFSECLQNISPKKSHLLGHPTDIAARPLHCTAPNTTIRGCSSPLIHRNRFIKISLSFSSHKPLDFVHPLNSIRRSPMSGRRRKHSNNFEKAFSRSAVRTTTQLVFLRVASK